MRIQNLFFLLASFLILITTESYSQENKINTSRPLRVGDTVPDIVFKNIVNYNKEKLRLSDFKGKLIVIDIWSIWCSSCIAGFPTNEVTQKNLDGKVQFLLLTANNREEFDILSARSRVVKGTKLPFILEDTIINKLFPHLGVPHHVWIDSNMIVRAVTNEFGTSEGSLRHFLLTGDATSVRKRDGDWVDFNADTSLLLEGNGRVMGLLQSYSAFFNSMPNYPFKHALGYYYESRTNTEYNYLGVRFINITFKDLAKFTFRDVANISYDFEGGDKYLYPNENEKKNDFIKNYKFCYEMQLPQRYMDSSVSCRKKAIVKKVKSDIFTQFGFSMNVEEREYASLDLVKTGQLNFIGENPSGEQDSTISEHYQDSWIFKNYPIESFVNSYIPKILKQKIKVVNKTGYNKDITLQIKMKGQNIGDLNKELARYNVRLVPSKVRLKTIVVEKNNELIL